MATCPVCNVRNTTMTVVPTGRLIAHPVGEFSLAGAQMKFSASDGYELVCDPELGGCSWSVAGYIRDGHLVAVP